MARARATAPPSPPRSPAPPAARTASSPGPQIPLLARLGACEHLFVDLPPHGHLLHRDRDAHLVVELEELRPAGEEGVPVHVPGPPEAADVALVLVEHVARLLVDEARRRLEDLGGHPL